MSFVAAGVTISAAIGGALAATTVTAVLVGATIGAVVGGISAAITGGNILKGMLIGGLVGGISGGIISAISAPAGGLTAAGSGAGGGGAGSSTGVLASEANALSAFETGSFATTNMVTGASTGVDLVSPSANLAVQGGAKAATNEIVKEGVKTTADKLGDAAINSTVSTSLSTGSQALQGSSAEDAAKEAKKKAEAEAIARYKITTANYGGVVGGTPLPFTPGPQPAAPKTDIAAVSANPATTTSMDYRNFTGKAPTTTPPSSLYNPQGAPA